MCSAKDTLWEGCKNDLSRLKLEKKNRRASASRSQELADLDDILEAFDALDADSCLPEVVCSSEDLLLMPQLLPLHSIEHVTEELCNFQEEVKSRLDAICNLSVIDLCFPDNVGFTYLGHDGSKSWLDHIAVSNCFCSLSVVSVHPIQDAW